MSSAKEMFRNIGFIYADVENDLVVYSDKSSVCQQIGENGVKRIIIYRDGSFEGFYISAFGKTSRIKFSYEMLKAILQQIIEFKIIRFKYKEIKRVG